jgi:hypothetical protein
MSSNATDHPAESPAPDVVNASRARDRHLRPFWVVGGMVAVLLVGVGLGLGMGRLLQGGADSESSFVAGTTVVAGNDLTERQLEMLDVTERYVDAWIEKDGDAVASFMVPGGFVDLPTLGDRSVRADDGTLQDWVESVGQIPNELNAPIIVEGNRVVLIGQGGESVDWMISIEFTTSGEVLIVNDTHWVWL